MSTTPELLWSPPPGAWTSSRMGRFLDAAGSRMGRRFDDYDAAWRWSVDEPAAFWTAVRDELELWDAQPGPALDGRAMPDTRWYPDARLSFPERLLRLPGRADDDVVIIARSATRGPLELTASELREQVARARSGLRRLGVGPGDRVAGYVPNVPEAVVAMLAATSLGAAWSSCAPEFGSSSVLDRFAQLEPTVLIAVDGYRHRDRPIDRRRELDAIRGGLPGLRATVLLPYLDAAARLDGPAWTWTELLAETEPITFERVAFEHPLWVLYSSGTTGKPKPIVHGHGGMLLELAKATALHTDLGPDDRFLWATTTGWMMWNYVVGALIAGSTIVLVDGDPAWPDLSATWRIAAETGTTYLGVGAPLITAARKAGLRPREEHDLTRLRGLGSTGAPLPADGFRWAWRSVGEIPLGSLSGGTDLCTGFLGPSPLVPVWAGEISCRMLGANVQAWSPDGTALVGEEGELVIATPMPSMPVGLLGDDDGRRYRETWLGTYPGVWRHGDWVTITERGSCIVSGRSDATLNRGGIRAGTAELYAAMEDVDGIDDSLVVHLEDPDGGPGELIAFVATSSGVVDEALRDAVARACRERISPRHVPDRLVAVHAIPRTLSGKKVEVPVKRILLGADPAIVVQAGSLADASALDAIVAWAREQAVEEDAVPG